MRFLPNGVRRVHMSREQASKLLILKTARQMAKASGWNAVSVRKIADQMCYKAPVIYEFFESREDLVAQVLIDGFEDLRKTISVTWKKQGSPKSSLVAVCLAYWKYANKNPEIYEAMGIFVGLKKSHGGLLKQAEGFCSEVSEILAEWAEAHSIKKFDPLQATEILWAHLHGLVSLGISGQLGGPRKVEGLIERSCEIFENGLKAV